MATFEAQFAAFSKFGDTKSDGTTMTLSQSDKWMKQAKVFDKTLTTTDSGICFGKLKKKAVTLAEYNKYLDDLARSKSMDVKTIKDKMAACGAPGLSNVTQTAGNADLAKLTDTSLYTGAHKERFDKDGHGKGKEGR